MRDNKLREVKHTTDRWINPLNPTREQDVILTRLRIGHTWHTYKHLMSKTEPEECLTCGTEITVKHILLECRQFSEERLKHNISNYLSE